MGPKDSRKIPVKVPVFPCENQTNFTDEFLQESRENKVFMEFLKSGQWPEPSGECL